MKSIKSIEGNALFELEEVGGETVPKPPQLLEAAAAVESCADGLTELR